MVSIIGDLTLSLAIKQMREGIPGGKFFLVVDEADAMFRTVDRRQVFEEAFEQLRRLGPSMTAMISASKLDE